MSTNSIISTIVVTTTLLTAGLSAQTDTPAPATPGPVVAASPASPLPPPNSVIYIPRLPTPAELSNAAAAQGLAIDKMEQTSNQITVVYKYSNGQINTVAYQLLPTAGNAPTVLASPAQVVTAPNPTVIYTSPAPAYYYDTYDYGWPWLWPVAFDFGIGYHFHGGGFGYRHFGGFGHGGFHGGGHGFHH